MSDYGILINNSDGEVQIDSVYKNYVYCSSVTGTVNFNQTSVDITDTTKVPILAFKPSSTDFAGHIGFTKSGSTFTHAVFLGAVASLSIPIKIYVDGQVNALPTYGLIVRNDAGDVAFSSTDTPMRIIGVYTGSLAFNSGGAYVDKTVSDATNNYFMLVPIFTQYIGFGASGPPPITWAGYMFTRGLKRIDSTTIRIGQFIHYQFAGAGSTPTPDLDNWVADYILVEVS